MKLKRFYNFINENKHDTFYAELDFSFDDTSYDWNADDEIKEKALTKIIQKWINSFLKDKIISFEILSIEGDGGGWPFIKIVANNVNDLYEALCIYFGLLFVAIKSSKSFFVIILFTF